jgi:hypothetical protein
VVAGDERGEFEGAERLADHFPLCFKGTLTERAAGDQRSASVNATARKQAKL